MSRVVKALIVFLVIFLMGVAVKGQASENEGAWPKYFCLYYDWDRDLYFYSATVVVYSDNTFYVPGCCQGYWEVWNGAVSLTFTDGCCPLYAGSMDTMAGFMKCTTGDQDCEELPGYWYATPGECQQMQVRGESSPSSP